MAKEGTYCSGNRVTVKNSLQWKYPQLVKSWNKSKNDTLSSPEVAPGLHKAVWWRCEKG
ncbi:zinc-ribbon domain-containing protein [Cellulosispirillum alkaliphilum]|uniref:zinc-ribbon domain-containing protein n=1 Tax=Cellulosispirillum alkaliphilum TaxID=3039283 RepID=UPI003D6FB03E